MEPLTINTGVSLINLIAVAFSFGVLWTKVGRLEKDVEMLLNRDPNEPVPNYLRRQK